VKRARILLDAAAGKVRPEVAEWDRATDEAREEWMAQDLTAKELREKFDKIAKGARSLPVDKVLKHCMPRVETAKTRMAYFMAYLRNWAEDPSRREKLGEDYQIEDQTHRTVERGEFPLFVSGFMKAYTEHGDAWRKAIFRKAGETGSETRQAAEESQGHTAMDLTPKETESLSAAAEKHTTKKSPKKRASGK
jgi:hypothetical protein